MSLAFVPVYRCTAQTPCPVEEPQGPEVWVHEDCEEWDETLWVCPHCGLFWSPKELPEP